MAKIKTMKWRDETVEFGWGESNPVANGVTYKYMVTGSENNYSVSANPMADDIWVKKETRKGFSTVENAKYWAHEHHCKEIEKWLE